MPLGPENSSQLSELTELIKRIQQDLQTLLNKLQSFSQQPKAEIPPSSPSPLPEPERKKEPSAPAKTPSLSPPQPDTPSKKGLPSSVPSEDIQEMARRWRDKT